MKRRSFLAALFAAPMVPAVAKLAEGPDPVEALPEVVLPETPLIYEGGVLKLNTACLGQVRGGRIVSHDGRSVFDLGAGTFTIRA